MQNLAHERKKSCQSKRQPTESILSGIIRCPDCNRAFRRQLTSGKVYWVCSGQITNEINCLKIRILNTDVYNAFTMMIAKLIDNREYLIGGLIEQLKNLQNALGINTSKTQVIDKSIADFTARSHVIAKLYSKNILSAAEYTAQSSELTNKISALRIERRNMIYEDANDILIDELHKLNERLVDTTIKYEFDSELFEDIVDKIMVIDNTQLCFKLIGGIELTESISQKG